jgi:hypothetical protein
MLGVDNIQIKFMLFKKDDSIIEVKYSEGLLLCSSRPARGAHQ